MLYGYSKGMSRGAGLLYGEEPWLRPPLDCSRPTSSSRLRFFATVRRHAPHKRGEYRLVVAVLKDAIECFRENARARNSGGVHGPVPSWTPARRRRISRSVIQANAQSPRRTSTSTTTSPQSKNEMEPPMPADQSFCQRQLIEMHLVIKR